jgi:hypothetical protein
MHAALSVSLNVAASTPWAAEMEFPLVMENPGTPPPPRRCGVVQCTPSCEETSHRSLMVPDGELGSPVENGPRIPLAGGDPDVSYTVPVERSLTIQGRSMGVRTITGGLQVKPPLVDLLTPTPAANAGIPLAIEL